MSDNKHEFCTTCSGFGHIHNPKKDITGFGVSGVVLIYEPCQDCDGVNRRRNLDERADGR